MQPDRAMRLRHSKQNAHNKGHNLPRLAAVSVIAIAIIAWLLATIQPIPAASCTVTTYNGTYGTFNQCPGE